MNTVFKNHVLLHPNSLGNNLDNWFSSYGGSGLENALQNPEAIIPLLREAGLRGLGGSGTGRNRL